MTDQRVGMVDTTWRFAEFLGIPDSPMRQVMISLAEFMDGSPTGEQLALASAALRALTKEFDEQFQPKPPLQEQIEYLRNRREMRDNFGVDLPDIDFSEFELPASPTTATQLAEELGYHDNGRAVRRWLRVGFPDHPKHARWMPLSPKQVNYVRAHLPARTGN